MTAAKKGKRTKTPSFVARYIVTLFLVVGKRLDGGKKKYFPYFFRSFAAARAQGKKEGRIGKTDQPVLPIREDYCPTTLTLIFAETFSIKRISAL